MVFADDAVLGRVQSGKRGRSGSNQASFVAAVELDHNGHPHHVRFDAIGNVKGTTLAGFAAARDLVGAHGAIIVSPRQSSELEPFR